MHAQILSIHQKLQEKSFLVVSDENKKDLTLTMSHSDNQTKTFEEEIIKDKLIKEENELFKNKILKINSTETKNINYELEKIREELEEKKKEIQDLQIDKKKILENLGKSEIKKDKTRKEESTELNIVNQQKEQLEELISGYQEKVIQVEAELIDQKNEVNKMKSKGNSYDKNYLMMKQMYKTNEVTVKSMDREIKKLKIDLEKGQQKSERMINNVNVLAQELKKRGMKKKHLEECLFGSTEFFNLYEIFGGGMSEDSEMEIDSLVDLEIKKMNTQNFTFNEEQRLEFENQIKKIEEFDSGVFDSERMLPSPILQKKDTMEVDVLELTFRKEILSQGLFARNEDSELEIASHPEKAISDKSSKKNFKSATVNRINQQIRRRSRKINLSRSVFSSQFNENVNEETGDMTSGKFDFDADRPENDEQILKYKLLEKCRKLDPEIFQQWEREHLEMQINIMNKLEPFLIWYIDYSQEKLRKFKRSAQTALNEKSITHKYILLNNNIQFMNFKIKEW